MHSDAGYLTSKLFGLTVLRTNCENSKLTIECIDEGLKGKSGFFETELVKQCKLDNENEIDIIFLYIDPTTNNPISRIFTLHPWAVLEANISTQMTVNNKPLIKIELLL